MTWWLDLSVHGWNTLLAVCSCMMLPLFTRIYKRGVLFTPGVVVDGQVKSSGKVPSIVDLKKMLAEP